LGVDGSLLLLQRVSIAYEFFVVIFTLILILLWSFPLNLTNPSCGKSGDFDFLLLKCAVKIWHEIASPRRFRG
jgi:hypothetical protein